MFLKNNPFLGKPLNHKLLTIGFILLLIIGISVGSFFVFFGKNTDTQVKPETLVLLNIPTLSEGANLHLSTADGKKFIVPNNTQLNLDPGEYKISTYLDNQGMVEESFQVEPNKLNTFSFNLEPIGNLEASAKPLTNPNISTLNKPENLLNNNNENNAENKINNEQTATENIRTVDKVILPNNYTASNSNGINLSIISNEKKAEQYVTNNPNTIIAEPNKITKDLVLNTEQESLNLTNNCEVQKAQFDSTNRNIRYFKICEKSNENGFYAYNLDSEQSTKILATSDIQNTIRTAFDPNSNTMVFTKATGDFGIIQDGRVETIATNTRLSAPTFSPNGEYLLLINSLISKESKSYYESLGLEVKVVKWEEFKTNKDINSLKTIGTTYFINRQDDFDFQFFEFINQDEFRVGDSPKIFSISKQQEIAYQNDEGAVPGRIYKSNNQEFRVFQGTAFNSQNEILLQNVSRVIQVQNELYFLANNYLYRLNENVAIQAYPDKVLSLTIDNNTLLLVNSKNELVQFQF